MLSLFAAGQAEKTPVKKEKIDWKPYELKLGVNVIRSSRTFYGGGLTTHELEGALALHRYNLVVDLGTEENNRSGDYQYNSKGSYFRAGIDNNFVKSKKSGNTISLGLRYAQANFEESIFYESDFGFGDQIISRNNPNVTAKWAELVFNLRGKVVSNLYMGMTLRWQFARKLSGEGEFKSYDIPGFGNTKRDNSTQFDYYLAWRIPFREK